MWRYHQSTGQMLHNDAVAGNGYAGCGIGKNNPDDQSIADVGPVPCGIYTIGPAYTDLHTGPLSMHLIPSPTNEMFGRTAFLIHGDNVEHPGGASQGCIVLSHSLRQQIATSTDHQLEVLP